MSWKHRGNNVNGNKRYIKGILQNRLTGVSSAYLSIATFQALRSILTRVILYNATCLTYSPTLIRCAGAKIRAFNTRHTNSFRSPIWYTRIVSHRMHMFSFERTWYNMWWGCNIICQISLSDCIDKGLNAFLMYKKGNIGYVFDDAVNVPNTNEIDNIIYRCSIRI